MLYIIDISCQKSVFSVDNVPVSPGKKQPELDTKFIVDQKFCMGFFSCGVWVLYIDNDLFLLNQLNCPQIPIRIGIWILNLLRLFTYIPSCDWHILIWKPWTVECYQEILSFIVYSSIQNIYPYDRDLIKLLRIKDVFIVVE